MAQIKFWYLALVFFLLSNSMRAQNKVSGVVTDAQTGEPIAFANVFFTNTTFGASTNDKGEFAFDGFPNGKYDLTFAFVGYMTTQLAIEFSGETHRIIRQSLTPEVKVLSEVTVKPDTTGWKRNFREFQYHFLGTSKYAEASIILNPKDISLFFDSRDRVLVAHAKKPIIIENKLTGYRIRYYLHHFEYQSRTGLFTIYGLPQFEEMEAKSEGQKKRWAKERQRVYEGSLLHFMRSWRSGSWRENDFKVARLYRIANKERPSDEYLSRKIVEWRTRKASSGKMSFTVYTDGKIKDGDSLSYFMRMRSLPKTVDSLVNESLKGNEFDNTTEEKNYKGLLVVKYDRFEDPIYTQTVGRRDQPTKQQSTLHLINPLKIYQNGYYDDIRSVFLESYWSWSEKIATLLPLDYVPVEKD